MALTKVSGPLLHGSNDNLGNYVINNITGAAATFSSVSVGGTLTYDDVTNVDSVGIVTARGGLHVGAGGTIIYALSEDNGKVGIGTTDASHQITVYAKSANSTIARFKAINRNSNFDIITDASSHGQARVRNNIGATKIQLNSNGDSYFTGGDVGIGTNSPSTKLHIFDSSADPYLKIGGSGRDCGIQLDAATNFTAFRTDAANRLFVNAGADSIRFSINGSSNEKLRITSGGNVNIGTGETTQTARMLNVYGGAARVTQTSGGNTIEAFGHSTSGQSYGLLVNAGSTSGDYCANFRNKDGTAILRIRGDGNIGIGTDTPARTLHLHDDDSDTVQLHITNATTGATSNDGVSFLLGSDESLIINQRENNSILLKTDDTDRMVITSTGNIGINSTSPNAQFVLSRSLSITHGIEMGYSSSDGGLHFIQAYNRSTSAFTLLKLNNALNITSAGNVEVKASGADKNKSIQIEGTNGSSELQRVVLESNGENARFHIKTGAGGGTPTNKLTIQTITGNIGIGSATMLADTKVLLYDTSTTNYRSLAIDSLATNGSTLIYKQKGTQVISIGSGGGNNLSGSDITHGLIRSEVATIFAVGNSEKLRITGIGSLGVGNNDPVTPVHIKNLTGKDSGTYSGGQNDTASIRIEDGGSTNGNYHGIELRSKRSGDCRLYVQDIGTNLNDFCLFNDNGGTFIESIRVKSNGQVGINTNSHLCGRVTINNDNGFNSASITSNTDNIFLTSKTASSGGAFGASIGFSRVQYPDRRAAAIAVRQDGTDEDKVGLSFFTHADTDATAAIVEQFRLASDGTAFFAEGIYFAGTQAGISNDMGRLNVLGADVYGTDIEHGTTVVMTNEQGQTTQAMVLGDTSGGTDGNVLWGVSVNNTTTDPTSGSESGWSQKARVEGNGDFVHAGSHSASGSDDRLKKNKVGITSALSKVCAMEGFTYEWNDVAEKVGMADGNKHLGLSAQTVEPLVPEVVVVNDMLINHDDGTNDYKTIRYERLVPLLVEAIKDLKTENDSLKTRISALEGS